ncbi:hypothetical protein Adt_12913 [Abeliophyllum distichum]|uniref:Uncharacterized protein n=1 Tax=Abeliophyllum distichum TaxID=126358 RepID=A0ABD1TVC2_9LAMI
MAQIAQCSNPEIFAVLAQKAASMAKAESSRESVAASEIGSDPDPNFEDDNEDDCLGIFNKAPFPKRGSQPKLPFPRRTLDAISHFLQLQSMVPLSLTSPSAASLSLTRPDFIPTLKPIYSRYNQLKKLNQRRARNGKCRAELSADAPVAIAIGACILSSWILPATPLPEDNEGDSLIDSADARFAVMGIIGLIPYFNWMSWVFAWMDTGKRRYAVYAIVYLAPYLRSNFSLSPEESWLPIGSILLCIIHIQLEASIKNGDLQGFQIFNEVVQHLWSIKEKKNKKIYDEGKARDYQNLPSAQEQSRNEIQNWGLPRKPAQDPEHLNQDGETNGESKD